ncbi:MAG: maleylacetoacetate isomerase [Rhizobium sp.]|nr:maleylacetoacetate isomerase [Rhizobium sp.]
MSEVVLHDYWRSSASYRVRIALNVVGLEYDSVPVDILKGEQRQSDYLGLNPQGLLPTLELDGHRMTQSLAIIEYLAELHPEARMLPADPLGRHRVRALSYAIAMDIHPICNSHVAAHVVELTGREEARPEWMRRFIGQGLKAFEALLDHPATGTFCHGDLPGMADFCLVPQVYNAERWGADLSGCARLLEITERCRVLPAFAAAHPHAVRPAD